MAKLSRYVTYIMAALILGSLLSPLVTTTHAQTYAGIFHVYVNGKYINASTGYVPASPGDAIKVTGVSYRGDYPLQLKISYSGEDYVVLSIYPKSDGSFTATFTLPEMPRVAPDQYTLTIQPVGYLDEYLYWDTYPGENFAPVDIRPKIMLEQTTLTNFDNLTIIGVGFSANATVTIKLYQGTTTASPVLNTTETLTNSKGSFTITIGSPNLGISDNKWSKPGPEVFYIGGEHLVQVINAPPDNYTINSSFVVIPGMIYIYYDPITNTIEYLKSLTLPRKVTSDVKDPYIEFIVTGLKPNSVYSFEFQHYLLADLRLPIGVWEYFYTTVNESGNLVTYKNALVNYYFYASVNGTVWLHWEPWLLNGNYINGSVYYPNYPKGEYFPIGMPFTSDNETNIKNGRPVDRLLIDNETVDLHPLPAAELFKSTIVTSPITGLTYKLNFTIPAGTYSLLIYEYNYNETTGYVKPVSDNPVQSINKTLSYNPIIEVRPAVVPAGGNADIILYSFIPSTEVLPEVEGKLKILIDNKIYASYGGTIYDGSFTIDISKVTPTNAISGTVVLPMKVDQSLLRGGHEVKATEYVAELGSTIYNITAITNFIVGSGYVVEVPKPARADISNSVIPTKPTKDYVFYDKYTGVVYGKIYSVDVGCNETGYGSCGSIVHSYEETINSSIFIVRIYGVGTDEEVKVYINRFYKLFNETKDLAVSYRTYFNDYNPGGSKMLIWKGVPGSPETYSPSLGYCGAYSVSYDPINHELVIQLPVIALPQGTYQITVETSKQGAIQPVTKDANTELTVLPKLFIKPTVVVGPALLYVEAWGFPAAESIEFIAPLVNGSDAMAGVNLHIRLLTTWTVDENGTLLSLGFGDIKVIPGLYLPALEPGAYDITLLYRILSLDKYNLTAPTTVYVVNNITKLVSSEFINQKVEEIMTTLTNDLGSKIDNLQTVVQTNFNSINNKLDQISAQISNINVTVDLGPIMTSLNDIQTALGTMQLDISTIRNKIDTVPANILAAIYSVGSKVDSLSASISGLSDSISNVGAKVDSLSSSISALSNDVAQVKSLAADIPNIASKVDSIESAVNAINSKVDNIAGDVVNSLSGLLNQIKSSADAAKSSADSALNAINTKATELSSAIDSLKTDLGSKVDTTQTAVYLAIIFALLAFIGSIVTLLMFKKASAA